MRRSTLMKYKMSNLIIANITSEGKISKLTTTCEKTSFSLLLEYKSSIYTFSWKKQGTPDFNALLVQAHDSPRPLISSVKVLSDQTTEKHAVSFSNGNIKVPTSFWIAIYLGKEKPVFPVYNTVSI